MNINDFKMTDQDQFILDQTDRLVEAGIPRDVAKVLVTKITEVVSVEWKALLEAFDGMGDISERTFCRTALMSYIKTWMAERETLFDLTQAISLQNIIDRG